MIEARAPFGRPLTRLSTLWRWGWTAYWELRRELLPRFDGRQTQYDGAQWRLRHW
jgi:hypothetical protein